MNRQYYLDLAARGLRVPIATHLILHEQPDPEKVLLDGRRLASVMADTADRFQIPLALSVMDLALENEVMLETIAIPEAGPAHYQFERLPAEDIRSRIHKGMDVLGNRRMKADCEALARIADRGRLLPVGMAIGPFSLLTKLVKDPITPIFLAGSGQTARDSEEVAMMEALLSMAEDVVHASCIAQCRAGAKAVLVCEPAANAVYFSPNQIRQKDSKIFSQYVIEPNRRLKALFDAQDCDLLLHDCGELIPEMVSAFAVLDPALISFGSPVTLWEMAPFVPNTTVIFGNLPTKKFYSEEEMPVEKVEALAREICERMKSTGHPFILGSECDVLSVPGCERIIMEKVMAFHRLRC